MIRLLDGPDLGVPRIPECFVVEWREDGKRVVFSFARQGNGIAIHFAAGPDAVPHLEAACNDFIEWIFWAYTWCEMVFGVIGRKSIEKLAIKCGFTWLAERQGYQVYMRKRP